MLLDVMMPPPDGYDVCQRVRTDLRWKYTRIIMLTARDHAGRVGSRAGQQSGASALVSRRTTNPAHASFLRSGRRVVFL